MYIKLCSLLPPIASTNLFPSSITTPAWPPNKKDTNSEKKGKYSIRDCGIKNISPVLPNLGIPYRFWFILFLVITSSSNSSSLNVNSDTPQGEITKTNILSGNYATSTGATESEINDETTNESTSSGSGNTQEDYTKTIKGNSGVSATAQKMIEQYRDNIISIDRDIIKELNILFMGLY